MRVPTLPQLSEGFSYIILTISAAFITTRREQSLDIDAGDFKPCATCRAFEHADRVDDPMRINPLAFDTEADSVSYVEKYDDLTTDDVVGFDEFDRDLAVQYRSSFFD